MASLNRVELIGRLGRDPELKTTQTGKKFCRFSVATDEGPKDKPVTMWHQVMAWEKTAELCARYLAKGRQVHIEGRLQANEYEKDGVAVKSYQVVAQSVLFLGSGEERRQPEPEQSQPQGEDDDIPF